MRVKDILDVYYTIIEYEKKWRKVIISMGNPGEIEKK